MKTLERLVQGTLLAVSALLATAFSAHAESYRYFVADPQSDMLASEQEGGVAESFDFIFDADANTLQFSAVFSASEIFNTKPEAMQLILTNGFMPQDPHQAAILYFDATSGAPVMTAYTYNAMASFDTYCANKPGSYLDGDYDAAGLIQPPDVIHSALDTDWILQTTVSDNADGTRTLGFTISVAALRAHIPTYVPGFGSTDDWYGIGFGEDTGLLGAWFWAMDNVAFTYTADGVIENMLPASHPGYYCTNYELIDREICIPDECGLCPGEEGYNEGEDECGLCPDDEGYGVGPNECGVCDNSIVPDECGVCDGDGSTCACEVEDLGELTRTLDNNSLALYQYTKSVTSLLRTRFRQGALSHPNVSELRNLAQRAQSINEDLHMKIWADAIETLPAQTETCGTGVFCISIDSTGTISTILNDTRKMLRVVRIYIQRSGLAGDVKAREIFRESRQVLENSERTASQYPDVVQSCF